MDAIEVSHELRRVQAEFHALAHAASAEDLERCSRGTRWTNRQLLFHMVLGYLVVRPRSTWSEPARDRAGFGRGHDRDRPLRLSRPGPCRPH